MSSDKCPQELCLNWTGMGCACQVYDLEPNIVEPEPLTFEELVWACPNCGWTSALCTEHREQAEEIRAGQDEDARRDEVES